MRLTLLAAFAVSLPAYIISQTGGALAALQNDDVQAVVAQAVRPVMKQYGIPGMAVGVTIDGRHYVFDYGVASKATGKHVDASTLFEIGSITKTFTASLVSYAQLIGKLSLSDEVSADLPSLRGTSFDNIRLLNLGGTLPVVCCCSFPTTSRTMTTRSRTTSDGNRRTPPVRTGSTPTPASCCSVSLRRTG
jgi:beta-lactamase class C